MRKNVLGLVLAALAFSTFGAFAQTETSETKARCEQVAADCKKGEKHCKKGDKDCRKGKADGKKKRGMKGDAFAGITLIPEQQQKVDALRAERKAAKEKAKKERSEAKAQEKKEFNEKLATILTPEQYAQYQANCDSLKARKQQMKVRGEKKVAREIRKGEGKGSPKKFVKKSAEKN